MTPHREKISAVVIWVKNMTRWMRKKKKKCEGRQRKDRREREN
jgi:hypothetical protein